MPTTPTKRRRNRVRGGPALGGAWWDTAWELGKKAASKIGEVLSSDTAQKVIAPAVTRLASSATDALQEKVLGTKKKEAEATAAATQRALEAERIREERDLELERRRQEQAHEVKLRQLEAERAYAKRIEAEDRAEAEERKRLSRSGLPSSQSRKQAEDLLRSLEARYPQAFASYPQFSKIILDKALDALESEENNKDPFYAQKVFGELEYSIAQTQNRVSPGSSSPAKVPAITDYTSQQARNAPTLMDWMKKKPKPTSLPGLGGLNSKRGGRMGGGLATVLRP